VELRITIIGNRIFAAETESQSLPEARLDWRRGAFSLKWRAVDLPEEISGKCLQLARRLGLAFGAIDMIVNPDGEYIFLEIHPSGQWLWIEEQTGLPLLDCFCEMLVQSKTAYSTAVGRKQVRLADVAAEAESRLQPGREGILA
jgi:glutathione synthase/RimK-type ligase-like ATP-grasp enzyme